MRPSIVPAEHLGAIITVIAIGTIHWTVRHCDDERGSTPIHSCKVLLEPCELFLRFPQLPEPRLTRERNEVNRSHVPREIHVAGAPLHRHVEALDVVVEISELIGTSFMIALS